MNSFRYRMLHFTLATGSWAFLLLCCPISYGADWAIAIHGGAGGTEALMRKPPEQRELYRQGLNEALQVGKKLLSDGTTSLEVVEAVVRTLEDNPLFNAGKGAVFNHAGAHELDASIMDGKTKDGGAVAGVQAVKNPISLARLVMSETRHVLLGGAGAEEFAREQGVEMVSNDYFSTEERRTQWQRMLETSEPQTRWSPADELQYGTVGCVALDQDGNLAAATSTGGMTNKRYGRIGDSPILGAGTYADNATCAVSGTGVGEQFIRNAVAAQISLLMRERGCSVQAAADFVIQTQLRKGDGGVVCVSHTGEVAWSYNSAGMFRAAADSEGLNQVLIGDEQTQ